MDQFSRFYGDRANTAQDELTKWYSLQGFEQEDIIDDFTPNDFINCDGVHIFADSLNINGVQNQTDHKKNLFAWFCHFMHSNITAPPQEPQNDNKFDMDYGDDDQKTNDNNEIELTIEQIRDEFKRIMKERTAWGDKQSSTIIHEISQAFFDACTDGEYDNMAVMEDLTGDIDDSCILDSMAELVEMLENDDTKQLVFNLLKATVQPERKCNCNLKTYRWSVTDEEKKQTKEILDRDCPNMFSENNTRSRNDSNEDTDKALCFAKSIDRINKFPLMLCLKDLYSRYIIETHRKNCEKKESIDTTDDTLHLEIETWFKTINPACKYIKQTNKYSAELICVALRTLCKRVGSPKMNLNYKSNATIMDSFDSFAKYAIALHDFIYNLGYVQAKLEFPFQIDFWIIPKEATAGVYHDFGVDEDDMVDALIDDDDDSKVGAQRSMDNDIEKSYLIPNHYAINKDYFVSEIDIENIAIVNLKKEIGYLINKADNDGKLKRYGRYIIIVDRRHARNEKDQMFLICPKKCNTISNYYEYQLNETFAYLSKHYLLPRHPNSDTPMDFMCTESLNGYKFVISHHMCAFKQVKTYWYCNGGSPRFYLKDIEWLWSRFFNKNISWQALDVETGKHLKESIERRTFKDCDFDQFCRQNYADNSI